MAAKKKSKAVKPRISTPKGKRKRGSLFARKARESRARPSKPKKKKTGAPRITAQELDRREKKFSEIKKKVRPRKTSKTELVFVSAEPTYKIVKGKRVVKEPAGTRISDRNTRRKVYVFRQTRATKKHPRGKLIPYYTRREQKLKKKVPPKAVRMYDFDPTLFKSKRVVKEWFAPKVLEREEIITTKKGKKKKVKRKAKQPRLKKLTPKVKSLKKKKGKRGGLDFMDQIAPFVGRNLKQAADKVTERRDLVVRWSATVKLPGGQLKTFDGFALFKQADLQQFLNLGFYLPFVQSALYSQLAAKLAAEGLVTAGSAKFIKKLPANKGKPRNKWVDSKGMKWKGQHHKDGWQMDQVTIERFDILIEQNLAMQ